MTRHVGRWSARAAAVAAMVALSAGAPGQIGGPASLVPPRGPNPSGLLARPEVQTEIGLGLRQRNALNALVLEQAAQRQQVMTSIAQLRGMPRQERMQQIQQIRAQMQAQTMRWQGELDPRVKEILRPEQLTRLHELDLQKRGVLALADPRVAGEARLPAEQRQAIMEVVRQADLARQQAAAEAYQAWRQAGGAPGAAPDLSSPLSPLRRKLDAADRQADAKVRGLLTADETSRWKALLGKRFVFRSDDRRSAGPPRF